MRRGILVVNPNRPGHEGGGWKALVHDLSHLMWQRANRDENVKPHEKGHAKLELRMIKEVIKRGWLNPEPEKAPPLPPTKQEKQTERYERIKARIASWERKERRVLSALKHLRRKAAYYERQLSV